MSRQVKSNKSNPWFNSNLAKLKHQRRHLERTWKHTHAESDLHSLREVSKSYHKSIVNAKQSYYANLIQSNTSNSRRLWNAVNSVLHRAATTHLPSQIPANTLSEVFATFFSDKVTKIQSALTSVIPTAMSHPQPPTSPAAFTTFEPTTPNEIH